MKENIIEICEVLILNDKQQVLLQLRDDKRDVYGAGKWGVLGGAKNASEENLECIIREMREEIDLEIEPVLITTIDDKEGGTIFRHHIYKAFFYNRPESLILKEGQRIEFFNLGALAKLEKVQWFEKVYWPIIKNI